MFDNVKQWMLFSLTLGLAPFFGQDEKTGESVFQPHVWGKLKWVLGGAHGMQLMDWGDLLMHGAPWVGLLIAFSLKAKQKWVK